VNTTPRAYPWGDDHPPPQERFSTEKLSSLFCLFVSDEEFFLSIDTLFSRMFNVVATLTGTPKWFAEAAEAAEAGEARAESIKTSKTFVENLNIIKSFVEKGEAPMTHIIDGGIIKICFLLK